MSMPHLQAITLEADMHSLCVSGRFGLVYCLHAGAGSGIPACRPLSEATSSMPISVRPNPVASDIMSACVPFQHVAGVEQVRPLRLRIPHPMPWSDLLGDSIVQAQHQQKRQNQLHRVC